MFTLGNASSLNNNEFSLVKKNDNTIFFFFMIIMIFCFGVVSTDNTVDLIKQVYVFHFNLNIKMLIGIFIFFTLVSVFKRPNMDKISSGLIASAVLGLVPLMYVENTSSYWGNYLPVLISIFSYTICSQSKVDFSNKLFKITCLVCIIISVQVIATELNYFSSLSFGNFSDVSVKALMNIPIGASNLIAAYLLPMLIFINSFKRNIFTFCISLLTIYALILCRSKNALSVIMLFVFFIVIKKIYSFILNDKSVNKKTKIFITITATTFFGFIFIFVLNMVGSIVSDLQFSYQSPIANPTLNYLDSITSGRILVFQNELTRFTDHIFLGNGFGSTFGQAKSHNWIIEVLVQRGIIGALIYVSCLVTIFKSGLKFYKTDKFIRAGINLLLILFIQGLAEVTVFTSGIDFLIWSISGFIISRSKQLKLQNKLNI